MNDCLFQKYRGISWPRGPRGAVAVNYSQLYVVTFLLAFSGILVSVAVFGWVIPWSGP